MNAVSQPGARPTGDLEVTLTDQETKRKRAEQEILALNAGLDERMAAQTAEFHAANAELRNTKERLEATLNALPDLMFRLDREGGIHDFHSSATDRLYLAPELFLGKRVSEVLPAEAALVIMDALAEAAIHGTHHGGTYSLAMPQGELWFEISLAAMGGASHPSNAFVMLVRDITRRVRAEQSVQALNAGLEQRVAERTADLQAEIAERKQVEQDLRDSEWRFRALSATLEQKVKERTADVLAANAALRESEERYRGAFENSLDAIVITRLADGLYLDVNHGFVDIVGYERTEVIGLTGIDLNIWIEPAARTALIELIRRDHKVRNYEARFRRKNGEVFWGLVSASLFEFKGAPCILSVTRDITGRKRSEGELRRARDAAETANRALQTANAELNRLATTDGLTDVWNRRHFEHGVGNEIARAQRDSHPLSLLMFDIDRFKAINDRYGHQAGDRVLVELSQRVRNHLRTVDVLARWGGEEFLAMLPNCRLTDALQIGEKLRALVAGCPFPDVGIVTVSVGVGQLLPHEGFDAFLKRVDDALYSAKAAGRDQVCVDRSAAVAEPPAVG